MCGYVSSVLNEGCLIKVGVSWLHYETLHQVLAPSRLLFALSQTHPKSYPELSCWSSWRPRSQGRESMWKTTDDLKFLGNKEG